MKRIPAFMVLVLLSANALAQNLTGSWEGEEQFKGYSYDYSMYISKSGEDQYSGVTVAREKKQLGTKKVITLGNVIAKRPKVAKRFIGKLANDTLIFYEVDFVEKDASRSWQLQGMAFVYKKEGDKEILSVAKNSSGLTLQLKKESAEYPDDYSKYIIGGDLVSLATLNFTNSKSGSKINFNDKGKLSFELKNNTDINFQQVNIHLRIKESNHGLLIKTGDIGQLSILANQSNKGSFDVLSGFDIPTNQLHLSIDGYYRGLLLFEKDFVLDTDPFNITDQTVLSKSSTQTLNALSGYFGFNKSVYKPVGPTLDPLCTGSNKQAIMWKSIFQYMGYGGFSPNEQEALANAQRVFEGVMMDARNGDAESKYLLFYAIEMGLGGPGAKASSKTFLKDAADAGYLPARYDYALLKYKEKKYTESLTDLQSCFDKGVQKAATTIGHFYEKGYAIKKDITKAVEWYKKGELFGDPDALMKIALLYSDGEAVAPEIEKALSYATKAANLKNTGAMMFLGNLYLNGKQGVKKDIPKSISWFRQAADLGDVGGMTSLAFLHTSDELDGFPKDERSSYFWAKKSAELGSARSMALMAGIYAEGRGVEKNTIKSRYWYNQARLRGIGPKQPNNTNRDDLLSFFRHADFSPSYYYLEENWDGTYTATPGGPDLLGGLFSGFMGSYLESRMRSQPTINGLELIYEKDGKEVYGGTITSSFVTNLTLKKDEKITITSYGSVTLGWMLSGISPNGTSGYQSYSIVPAFPHGSVIAGIDTNWNYIGSGKNFIAANDGKLRIAINDRDYTNNQGYFDVVIVRSVE